MGGYGLDRGQDRLYGGDPAALGTTSREGQRGTGGGATSVERERIKALEREVRELRQAHEILRKASAYFAQTEFDRPFKR